MCVAGGGPAGSVAARLLASWGWSVVLVQREPPGPALAESIPPSTDKLFRRAGLDAIVAGGGFHPNCGSTSRWAGRVRRAASPNTGIHVLRSTFDRLLLDAAADAGVHVVEGTVIDIAPGSEPRVAWRAASPGPTRTCTSQFALDCSGRAGIAARKGLRRREGPYRTLAVAASWRAGEWPPYERSHTVIDSAPHGWAWSVPTSPIDRQCTVMIDPAVMADAGCGPRGLQTVYVRELARMDFLGARLRAAQQVSAAWARDASVYDCSRASDDGVLLVGDAASFVDPLSSAGVKKAITSAWRAAVVVNTCLRDSGRRQPALAYHDLRERQVADACRGEAAKFLREAADRFGTAFWSDRKTARPDAAAVNAPEVASAFERLRSSRHPRLKVAPHVRIESAPTIEGVEVVLRDALVLPGESDPLQYESNINVAELVRVVGRRRDISSVLADYQSRVAEAAPADILRVLSLLVVRGALIHEGAA